MDRKLTSLLGNSQKLDGGAMFGNVPKALWSKWMDADEHNRVHLVCRALLVQDAGRHILFETGIGAFFEPKYKDRYGVVEDEHVLLKSLAEVGLQHTDIDIVVLSHLHFDHAGGLLSQWQADHESELLFPNATYLIGEIAWLRAQQPHPRDRASFIPKLNQLLADSARVEVITDNRSTSLGEGYCFHYSNGHTPGMMHTEITMSDGPVFFAADLIPGTPWLHLPITMGYDRAPEQLVDEKKSILNDLLVRNGRLFYTHDPKVAISSIAQDNKGRFIAVKEQQEIVALDH